MNTINSTLTAINSFEEFENLKPTHKEIFEDAAKKILAHHNLPLKSLTLFSEGTNIVFSYDNSLVIKLFPPFHQNQFESERLILKALEGKLSVETPVLNYEGEYEGARFINKRSAFFINTRFGIN